MEKQMFTYLMFDGQYYKIGQSTQPEKRLKQIKTGNPSTELLCYGNAISEKYLHTRFYQNRIKGEWFYLNNEQLQKAIELIKHGENFIKSNRKFKHLFTWDTEVYKMKQGKLKSDKLSEKYVIEFGKYKGTPIKEMLTDEQYKYCKWLYNEMNREMSRSEKSKSRKYKAFYWLLQNFDKLNNITSKNTNKWTN
jgi:hypothetical protein